MSTDERSITADLELDEVQRLVGMLPEFSLAELADGPLPDLQPGDPGYADAEDCRVCTALEPLPGHPEARALLAWHDLIGESFELVHSLIDDDVARDSTRQCQELVGATSYARCCTIYALASLELAIRAARALDASCGSPQCACCGCTTNFACPDGCGWSSMDPPVCTACVAAEDTTTGETQ